MERNRRGQHNGLDWDHASTMGVLRQLADDPSDVYGDEDRLQGEQGDDWLLGGHGPISWRVGLAQMFC